MDKHVPRHSYLILRNSRIEEAVKVIKKVVKFMKKVVSIKCCRNALINNTMLLKLI